MGRLAQISGASRANYTYDPQGRRIQKIEAGVTTRTLYDGVNNLVDYPGSSWTSAGAVYVQAGTDFPLARLTGNTADPGATATYYHQDGLGSILATTGANATVTASQRFDAYGNPLSQTGSIPAYGYTGREPGTGGLIYYRARYYNPTIGRFTQRDPMGYAAGINLYAYVNNNPVNFNDPSGLVARAISNGATQTVSYFNNNAGAAFGGGLAVGGALGYGTAYGLGALSAACLPCRVAAGVGLAGYAGYKLLSDNFAGARNIGNSFAAVASGTATPGQAFTAGSTLGGILGGSAYGYTTSSASSSTTTLYRAVSPAELESIQSTNSFTSLNGLEGKYFTTSAEQADIYAREAVKAFGDEPYTIVQTQVPNRFLNILGISATIEKGIQAYQLPNYVLPGLQPNILNYSPIP